MPFNSDTYQANKLRKSAWASLAAARALRDRIRAGNAYDWEASITLPQLVRIAFWDMRRSIFFRNLSNG